MDWPQELELAFQEREMAYGLSDMLGGCSCLRPGPTSSWMCCEEEEHHLAGPQAQTFIAKGRIPA